MSREIPTQVEVLSSQEIIEVLFEGAYSEEQKKSFLAAQIEDCQKICDYLRTRPSDAGRISFRVFDNREAKQQADPNHSISRASARFDEMAVYRVWKPKEDPHFPHEITHLVSHKWAGPYTMEAELDTADGSKIIKELELVSTSFMQEGLAIAVDDLVFGRPLFEEGETKFPDDWCRGQWNEVSRLKLSETVNMEGFGNYANKLVIPFAGSFSKFLLIKFGMGKYRQMYVELKETQTPQENVAIIENVYGLTEEQLLEQWRASVIVD